MAFFDNFKEKVTDLAQAGAAKGKQMAEIAKLKTMNLAEEDAMKKAYLEIGKIYYAERGTAPEAAFIASCEKITAAKAAVAINNEKIDQLKAENDIAEEEIAVEVEVEQADEPEKPAE